MNRSRGYKAGDTTLGVAGYETGVTGAGNGAGNETGVEGKETGEAG